MLPSVTEQGSASKTKADARATKLSAELLAMGITSYEAISAPIAYGVVLKNKKTNAIVEVATLFEEIGEQKILDNLELIN